MNKNHSFFTHIRQHIAEDELKEAIRLLQDLLQNSPKLDEAILQSARLSDVSRQIRLGLIDDKQAELTQNQIRMGVLELVDEIEAQQTASPEVQEELEQFMTMAIFGENIVTGSVSAGGDVIIGDTTVTESGTSRRLKVFLYFVVPILAIAAAFLWYRLVKMKEPLTLTIAIDNRTPNPELPFEGGSVTLQYGDKSETIAIRQEADIKGIPANFRDETVALHFEAPGFVKTDTAFLLSGKRLTLPVRRDNSLARIFGTVKGLPGSISTTWTASTGKPWNCSKRGK